MRKRFLFLIIMVIAGTLIAGSQEPKIILTPRPGPEPRINGAKIFGVRPGSPFLFTIPATGKRPMKYNVLNLPAGLRCDPETGQIKGTINKPGEYLTTVMVTNELGSAKREFKVVCGDKLALTSNGLEQLVCLGKSCD
jgi:alpha-galactosidase